MTQEIKRDLILNQLARRPLISKKRKEEIADNILAIDLLDSKKEAELVADYKAKEIAILQVEKAKAEATLQEVNEKLLLIK
jgi:hypothetical protein